MVGSADYPLDHAFIALLEQRGTFTAIKVSLSIVQKFLAVTILLIGMQENVRMRINKPRHHNLPSQVDIAFWHRFA